MSVIYPPGTPVLDLAVESLSLLPAEKRWDVTFSTYFTKAPAGIDCQWRFLLDGTPEATALRRDVRAAVIDLCKPLGQAQGGDLVQAVVPAGWWQAARSTGEWSLVSRYRLLMCIACTMLRGIPGRRVIGAITGSWNVCTRAMTFALRAFAAFFARSSRCLKNSPIIVTEQSGTREDLN